MWNNDWDGSGLVLDDYLFEGGENSQFHVVKLNRAYGADGTVTVDPKLVFNTPGWDEQVIADLAGNRAKDVSIENSVAMSRQHRLLRQLGRPRAGLGHGAAAHRWHPDPRPSGSGPATTPTRRS